MKKSFSFIVCLFMCAPIMLKAKYKKISPYWTYSVLVSSTHFLGDLGGERSKGTGGFYDLELSNTRYALGIGIQYNLPAGFSFSLEAAYARLFADDRFSHESRKHRKLHVRTDLLEPTFKIEYTVPDVGLYFNTGIGVCFYKPMAKYNGKWHELRPLGTEGQNVDPNKDVYDIATAVVPFGIGKKFLLPNDVTLAIDFSFRNSFTDYLDDVSTEYYDNSAIQKESGDIAAALADPNQTKKISGSKRGKSTNNDNYKFVGFKLYLPIQKNYRDQRYRRYKHRGGRYR